MKIEPLTELKMAAYPKNNFSKYLQVVGSVNMRLGREHVIQESLSTQNNITEPIFNKLNTVEKITEKADTKAYLKGLELQKIAELQGLKVKLNELVTSKDNDSIVNDVIGG